MRCRGCCASSFLRFAGAEEGQFEATVACRAVITLAFAERFDGRFTAIRAAEGDRPHAHCSASVSWVLPKLWMPHSVLLNPSHRPPRSSSPFFTARVHGQQPMDANPCSSRGCVGI